MAYIDCCRLLKDFPTLPHYLDVFWGNAMRILPFTLRFNDSHWKAKRKIRFDFK